MDASKPAAVASSCTEKKIYQKVNQQLRHLHENIRKKLELACVLSKEKIDSEILSCICYRISEYFIVMVSLSCLTDETVLTMPFHRH